VGHGCFMDFTYNCCLLSGKMHTSHSVIYCLAMSHEQYQATSWTMV
jgi:hypothetical protein